MAYLYEKKINGNSYYYLRISKRVKNKIIAKDIAYLGNNISKIQEKLDALPSKYKLEIRKAYRNIKKFIDSGYYLNKIKKQKLKIDSYMPQIQLEEVEAAKLHFQEHFLKQNIKTIKNTYANFLIEFSFNTTSIEGNTITLEEANKLLRENLTPKNRTVREIFDLQNTQKTFFYLLDMRPKFSLKLIIKIHDMLLDNIDQRKGYRTHDIRVFKSSFESSPVKYVKTDMNLLFEWYQKFKNKLHPLVLVSLFHQKFEKIHPFSDGNGRTGRMIMNYLLIRLGYPPLIVQNKQRVDYLKYLSFADKSDINSVNVKYFTKLVNYFTDEFLNTYWNNFNV